ncbi:hypothetical protein ARMSODRAFT_1024600 [Armillaria solidipes]|uniref:Uncharacterized protein n=1 Tax=Armillaria solidipes TaxID=1076256 RepID=A0A2H3BFK4_9AGAR|nr:hypothetical protein ARMSODRAFT_1024600 [Armillaria solidipes]
MTTFLPELVEIIVHDIWNSEMPSFIRKSFMTTCPRIDRTWKAVYAPIASQDMYITNLSFLDYLYDIFRDRRSISYYDFIPRLTRTVTCFVDLRTNKRESAAKAVYRYLIDLPNIRGFQALFKHVQRISFQIVWMGTVRQMSSPVLSPLRGIPVRVRYDRFFPSNAFPHHHPGKTRMCVYISVKDRVFWGTNTTYWLHTTLKLRNVGVPRYFFTTEVPESYRETVRRGVRHISHTTYISETELGSWDPRNINQRLWMASKGRPSTVLRFRCLVSLFYCREFKRLQSSLSAVNHYTTKCVPLRSTLLEKKNLL